MSAILAKPSDVTPSMLGLDRSNCVVGEEPEAGTFAMSVGGFIMIGVGFIITGVGFIMTGVGFIMTGVGFIMIGIGFIILSMPDIPDPIDNRSLRSSVSKQIGAFRRDLRATTLRWFRPSCDLIGLILRE
jgi:hypothetical protein